MRSNLAEDSFAMQASPSKARAVALESHSWSLVLDWLSTLYQPSPIPAFERNAFTLQALQSLMGENIAAERLRSLVHEAQLEELTTNSGNQDTTSAQNNNTDHHDNLRRISATTDDSWTTLLYEVQSCLPPPSRAALDSISDAAVLAGCCSSSSSSLCPSAAPSQNTVLQGLQSHITNLPVQTFRLETQLASIDGLISTLQGEIKRIQSTRSHKRSQSQSRPQRRNESAQSRSGGGGGSLSSSSPPRTPTTVSKMIFPNDDADDDDDEDDDGQDNDGYHAALHAETVQHQRETKQLALKCAEYTDRIATLERHASPSSSSSTTPTTATANVNADQPTLSDVAEKQVLVAQKRKQLDHLKRRILAFHNLPPDLDASRAEVQRAQADLERLKNKRDDLFAQLAS
ncbi:hypothetical protein PV08_10341 [Exophiala spinifera]|uniref:Uncharacterized protein n=1 Tax=Exophiala spinifera TaxID=91928 RepID=A0A0D1ZDK0_9EURO|nr:uncharacterized protein PV08_10341 [Exophiala spinifera]KIW11042.1 hypothetical protein PV08_10341 [Exophiala spinifera]